MEETTDLIYMVIFPRSYTEGIPSRTWIQVSWLKIHHCECSKPRSLRWKPICQSYNFMHQHKPFQYHSDSWWYICKNLNKNYPTGSVVVYQKFNGFTQYKLLEAKLRTGNEIPSHLVEALHKTEKKEKDGRRKREWGQPR